MTTLLRFVFFSCLIKSTLAETVSDFAFIKDDFKPILEELVASHEGLNGLQNAPVSREKYGN